MGSEMCIRDRLAVEIRPIAIIAWLIFQFVDIMLLRPISRSSRRCFASSSSLLNNLVQVDNDPPGNGIAVLSLNKHPVNTLNVELINTIIGALDKAENDLGTKGKKKYSRTN